MSEPVGENARNVVAGNRVIRSNFEECRVVLRCIQREGAIFGDALRHRFPGQIRRGCGPGGERGIRWRIRTVRVTRHWYRSRLSSLKSPVARLYLPGNHLAHEQAACDEPGR